MDPVKIKMLRVLEALGDNGVQSQRALSVGLNISLGTVNALIQEGIKRGHLTVALSDEKKTTYSITPKGMEWKSELAVQYIQNSLEHYKYIKLTIQGLIEHLAASGVSNVVLYGANEFSEIFCIALQQYDLNLVAILDSEQEGKKIAGKTVLDSSLLHKTQFDAVLITSMPIPDSLKKILASSGVSFSNIYSIRDLFNTDTIQKTFKNKCF